MRLTQVTLPSAAAASLEGYISGPMTKRMFRQATMSHLFSKPSYLIGRLAPRPQPGLTPESTQVLGQLLTENHERFHCFTKQTFHNHTAHAILAKYWLGAKPDVLKEAFAHDESSQQANYASPTEVNEKTVYDHLGVAKYYDAYFNFFSAKIKERGIQATVEEYIFSRKSNFEDCFILSSTSVMALNLDFLELLLKALRKHTSIPGRQDPSEGVHVLTILSRIIKDTRWDSKDGLSDADGTITSNFRTIVERYGKDVYEYSNTWKIDLSKEGEIEKKLEELAFLVITIYAVAGYQNQELFTADFALVHLVTSSLFLSSIVEGLKPSSQELLLRGQLSNILAWYISRGRPIPDIQRFYSWSSSSNSSSSSPNEWHTILSSAIEDSDDHLCKTQRALAHYATVFGAREKTSFVDTELEGAELLDGTLFLRAAKLTEERRRIGREKGGFGGRASIWAFNGFIRDVEANSQNSKL
ncbi:hypothetical protein DL96DRAFT_1820857 [Flagelloscypha sp. PMI_526]|nr:hypothetical protein DL96DRAFT_1820857 [Flagelloscypha sp. PMI_526]